MLDASESRVSWGGAAGGTTREASAPKDCGGRRLYIGRNYAIIWRGSMCALCSTVRKEERIILRSLRRGGEAGTVAWHCAGRCGGGGVAADGRHT